MSEAYKKMVQKKHILHSSIFNQTMRDWHSLKTEITPKNLMYPVFIIEAENELQEIPSMPGVARYGINKLKEYLTPLVQKGLTSVLVFGVISSLSKDESATNADSPNNPVVQALPLLRKWFPNLTIACDVCLCPYSSHGHCGILTDKGHIDNARSIKRIAEISLAYAKAGAHIIAPSDMMDGRIGAIKSILIENDLQNTVSVLSYTCKFASSFYGPFRDAAKSAPASGDRKCYQLPPGGAGVALRAAERDVEEGADFLMVKPIMAYMDILKQVKDKYPEYPMFVYQVSGEYSMIYGAAQKGVFDLKTALMEILGSYRRAGADVIITYYTPLVLDWIALKHKL
ncbi:delta-aminolevulinic acid dehydratase [Anthonomus grandis grandis]|uniref:delta-aminolevulinic acid dehydratase n=1 Tax=Anthonomus grandis grandis TaxID=2921223 RepID=UPI0021653D10|nr:delta-aminolevulinic acid dehydratase [Anthonomus grandis grandis]